MRKYYLEVFNIVRQLAPLVSLHRLVSAGSALVALGPFLSALVTRTGWYSARPAARATGLAPRWSSLRALVARLSLLVARPQVSRRAGLRRPLPQCRSFPRAYEFHWNSAALVSSTLVVIQF